MIKLQQKWNKKKKKKVMKNNKKQKNFVKILKQYKQKERNTYKTNMNY